ncbi:MAG: hypothetical protein CL822_07225 [Crocinitomicaceae bacterium]|nr:hypothetical protein [Crocinitomicaceae bacterium]
MLDSHALVTDLGWTRETASKNRMKKRGIKHLARIVALGVLWMSMTGCSLQKRTTTRGFHIEKKSARVHIQVVAETASPTKRAAAPFKLDRKGRLAPLSTLPAQPMGTTLIPRRPFFDEVNSTSRLDTTSQQAQAPKSKLERVRDDVLKRKTVNFWIGLAMLPLSILADTDFFVFVGVACLLKSLYFRRLAKDNNRLRDLIWKEKVQRNKRRQRKRKRRVWQWVLLWLGLACLLGLLGLLVWGLTAATYYWG